MKKPTIYAALLLVLCSSFQLSASIQQEDAWKLLNRNKSSLASFPTDMKIPGRKIIFMEMSFNESEWKDASEKISANTQVESVELVSTAFAFSKTFNQDQLDRSRLSELEKKMPQLFDDARTEWKRISETGAATADAARKMFHGFVIICREPASAAEMKLEIKSLTDAFSPKRTSAASSSYIISDGEDKVFYSDTIPVTPHWKGSVKIADVSIPIAFALPTFYSCFSDSVVTSVFHRNRQWKEMLVVCDITGSMSPYTAQLFAWFKLNTTNNRVKNFVFFNDGDMKLDQEKTIGSTGGIYAVTASQFEPVIARATYAMSRGCGGDCPENNLEALQYGLANYGDAKEVVMIADNWATPRDMSLAASINRPVHIIVCGASVGINTAYLELARKTGGSVHTMEQDLTDLATMHEGETVSIGSFLYKLQDGHFVPVKRI